MLRLNGRASWKITYENLALFLSVVIALSSGTVLYNYGIRYMLLAALLAILVLKDRRIFLRGKVGKAYWLFAFVTLVSAVYSKDLISTLRFSFIYIACAVFVNMNGKKDTTAVLIKWMEKLLLFFAITIFVEVIFPSLLQSLAFLTSKSVTAIERDIRMGAYAGLAGDRAEAAVLMLVGISIEWARFCAKPEPTKRIFIKLAVFYLAIILTSKRMLFLCALVIPFVVLTMFQKGKRRIILILVVCIGAVAMLVLASKVSAFATLFARFQNSADLEDMNGRQKLWRVSRQMFMNRPVTGYGFASFNKLANEAGVRYGGSLGATWIYQGHNCYLQILGELGLVGFGVYLIMQWSFVASALRLIKRRKWMTVEQMVCVYFSFFLVIGFAVYSLTGNCEYYLSQVFLQAICYRCVNDQSIMHLNRAALTAES